MRLAQFLGVLVVGPIVALVALVLRRWRLALAALLVTLGKLAAERTVWHYVQPPAAGRDGTERHRAWRAPRRAASRSCRAT